MRRPLVWFLLLAVVGGGILLIDAALSHAEERDWANNGVEVTGTVDQAYDGGRDVPVTYTHPITGQQVAETVAVVNPSGLTAAPGEPIALLVDGRDPGRVRIAGDPLSDAGEGIVWVLGILTLFVVWWVTRWWAVRRVERRARSAAPTLVMLGAVLPPRRFVGRRCELHLWPLDAGPGAPSICRLPLPTTAGLPIGWSAFEVEVKGSPRPLGAVSVRSRTSTVPVWTVSRAPFGGHKERPISIVDPPALPEGQPGPSVSGPPAGPLLRAPLVALALTLVLVALVAAVVWHNKADADHIVAAGAPALVTVTGTTPSGGLNIEFDVDGQHRTGVAQVEFSEDFPVGNVYPARVDLGTGRAVLDVNHYVALPPLLWSAVPFVLVLLYVLHRARLWRQMHRLARRGPWRPMGLAPAPGGARDFVVDPQTGAVFASVRLAASTRPGAIGRGPYRQVLGVRVAGDVDTGGTVVVAASTEASTTMARASAFEVPPAPMGPARPPSP